LERQKKIYNRGLSSAHDLELAERDAARDRAEVDAAKAAVKRARVDLRRTRITAPMDGVVLQRKVHPGETVIANLQPPLLFRLAASLDRLDAVVAVPQDQVGGLSEGDALEVSFPGLDGRSREGEVVRVARLPGDSEADEARYPVRVRVANDGGELRPGMKARVTLP
jgi:HlyD family secretion protein